MPTAHVPVRTCVGCRERGDKRDLVRFVAVAGGSVRMDLRGSEPGRGAYVHHRRACLEAALSQGALARALRTGLSTEPLPLGRISRGNWIIEGS